MKRVYIIVEGQSEQEFVNEVLRPYLNRFEIYDVTPILIKTSRNGRGGFVSYTHMKNTIKPLLGSEGKDFIVTTLVDFFRMPSTIPNYDKCTSLTDKYDQVLGLEQSIDNDIADNKDRFFAYIQLHEFEALIFANNNGFEKYYDEDITDKTSLLVEKYNNPEDMNSTPEGAPSKRILSIIEDYDKVNDGNILALEVGISEMLQKCSRFRMWIEKIIERAC